MKEYLLWMCFGLLIFIHTADMELTRTYIGNNCVQETFLPMKLAIQHFGIYNALWISRCIMYPLFYIYILFRHIKYVRYLMVLGTILYWASMLSWLQTLCILEI